MPSRFLPASWPSSHNITLLCGQGGQNSYPWELIHAARGKNVKINLLALKGETSDEIKALFDENSRREVAVGDLGGMIKALKQLNTNGLIMAGQVTPGRIFKEVFPDMRAMALYASLKERNAETIFGAICMELEKDGIQVLDARTFMDAHVAEKGVMVKGEEKVKEEAIAHAVNIAEKMAELNVGQSVVCRKGTTLAVEAFEGTDAMIARAGQFDANEKIFVKTEKTRQDYRFDIPIFGFRTLEKIIEANVKTVVLKSEGVIIPQKEKVLQLAKEKKITILGY